MQEFEREPESWKLNAEESLDQAKLIKDKATGYLKQEKYELAIKLYEKANTYLSNCICKYFIMSILQNRFEINRNLIGISKHSIKRW